MSDHSCDKFAFSPEDLRCALAIHTQKITDACRDKDCIEDLRVYLTRESQAVLDAAGAAKVRSAELIHTAIDVSPVAFHRNHYTIDLTFYYKIIADAAVAPCRPAAICGLALFSKRAVLCGENTGAHIFRSDAPCTAGSSTPTAVVEVTDTNSLSIKLTYPLSPPRNSGAVLSFTTNRPAPRGAGRSFQLGIIGFRPARGPSVILRWFHRSAG